MISKNKVIRYISALTVAGLLAGSVFALRAASSTAAPVTFAVRTSPLSVKILKHKTATRGQATYIRATVSNTGKSRLTAGTVKISIAPRAAHSKATQSLGILGARQTKKVAWRVVFPRAGVYKITVLARARLSLKIVNVGGARLRLRVIAGRTGSVLSRLLRFIFSGFSGTKGPG